MISIAYSHNLVSQVYATHIIHSIYNFNYFSIFKSSFLNLQLGRISLPNEALFFILIYGSVRYLSSVTTNNFKQPFQSELTILLIGSWQILLWLFQLILAISISNISKHLWVRRISFANQWGKSFRNDWKHELYFAYYQYIYIILVVLDVSFADLKEKLCDSLLGWISSFYSSKKS